MSRFRILRSMKDDPTNCRFINGWPDDYSDDYNCITFETGHRSIAEIYQQEMIALHGKVADYEIVEVSS